MIIALVILFADQGLAVITGLAPGAAEPTGWQWLMVLSAIMIYNLGVIITGVCSILLIRILVKKTKELLKLVFQTLTRR